jgi:hypothetical protein
VIAEKLHSHRPVRDQEQPDEGLFDLCALAREGVVDAAILADAIAATFERRATEVPAEVPVGLADSFANEPATQAQWKAFLGRNRLAAIPLDEVVAEIRDLVRDPLRLAAARAKNSR